MEGKWQVLAILLIPVRGWLVVYQTYKPLEGRERNQRLGPARAEEGVQFRFEVALWALTALVKYIVQF